MNRLEREVLELIETQVAAVREPSGAGWVYEVRAGADLIVLDFDGDFLEVRRGWSTQAWRVPMTVAGKDRLGIAAADRLRAERDALKSKASEEAELYGLQGPPWMREGLDEGDPR